MRRCPGNNFYLDDLFKRAGVDADFDAFLAFYLAERLGEDVSVDAFFLPVVAAAEVSLSSSSDSSSKF